MNLKTYIQKANNIFLYAFVITTILPVKLNFSSITIIILLATSLINGIMSRKKGNYQLLILAIPLLVYIFGLINTENIHYGIKFITRNLSLIAFPVIFFTNSNNKFIQPKKILKALLITLFLVDIYLIYLFVYYFNIGEKFSIITTNFIYHSTYLGLYNIVAAWISFYIIYKNRKIPKNLIPFFFFLFAAVLTSSRIIFIATVCSVIIFILGLPKISRIKYLLIPVIILLTGTIIIKTPSLNEKFSQITSIKKLRFDKDNYQSISSRFGKIEAALKLIKKNPLFGVGTGDLKDKLAQEYKKMHFVMGYKHRYNAHNQYLDSLARNGIIGAIPVFFSLLIYPLFLAIKKKNKLLMSLIILVIFVSLTESVFDLQKGITFYAFLVTYLLAYNNQFTNDKAIT